MQDADSHSGAVRQHMVSENLQAFVSFAAVVHIFSDEMSN